MDFSQYDILILEVETIFKIIRDDFQGNFRTYVYLSIAGKLHDHLIAGFDLFITERANSNKKEE